MRVTIKLSGVGDFDRLLSNLPDKALKVVEKELKIATLDLMGKAQEIAPVDTGDLQGSAFTEVKIASGSVSGVVGFKTPYALRQHEELNYQHKSPGQAKYLEQPFKKNMPIYIKAIREVIIKVTQGISGKR